MKTTEFCYWLQGFFELSDAKQLDERQIDLIKRHLNLVFVHDIDPSYPPDQQAALNTIHSGAPVSKLPTPTHIHSGADAQTLIDAGMRPRC